jgi:hypothetical protein
MNTKKILIPSLAFALVAAIASMMIASRKTEPGNVSQPPVSPAPAPAVSESTPPMKLPAAEIKPEAPPAAVPAKANPQKIVTQAAPPANANGQLQDPTARVALSLVGADPAAEQYWTAAIFDPSLPDQEREDLMEDLNEDGLSDPQRPGPQDLPLIVNRIRIIEQIAPDADDFMLEHLGEAYKDLNNMLDGQPVR